MAKKSTKKDTVSLKTMIYVLATLLAFTALLLIFAPAVTMEYGLFSGTFKGTDLVFGLQDNFAFSFMNFLTYLLLIGGIVMLILKVVGKKSKLIDFLAAILLIVAGIMFFLIAVFAVPEKGSLCETVMRNGTKHLLVGSILSGLFGLLAGIGVICNNFLFKK